MLGIVFCGSSEEIKLAEEFLRIMEPEIIAEINSNNYYHPSTLMRKLKYEICYVIYQETGLNHSQVSSIMKLPVRTLKKIAANSFEKKIPLNPKFHRMFLLLDKKKILFSNKYPDDMDENTNFTKLKIVK